ncbi:hypothetical protein AAMO2058_000964200 [Amorphochlora amoebiformis]
MDQSSIAWSPLDKAHQFARQATEAVEKGHWQQAIDKHTRASIQFDRCLEHTDSPEAKLILLLLMESHKASADQIQTHLTNSKGPSSQNTSPKPSSHPSPPSRRTPGHTPSKVAVTPIPTAHMTALLRADRGLGKEQKPGRMLQPMLTSVDRILSILNTLKGLPLGLDDATISGLREASEVQFDEIKQTQRSLSKPLQALAHLQRVQSCAVKIMQAIQDASMRTKKVEATIKRLQSEGDTLRAGAVTVGAVVRRQGSPFPPARLTSALHSAASTDMDTDIKITQFQDSVNVVGVQVAPSVDSKGGELERRRLMDEIDALKAKLVQEQTRRTKAEARVKRWEEKWSGLRRAAIEKEKQRRAHAKHKHYQTNTYR